MPVYIYQCKDCLSAWSNNGETDDFESSVLFETSHSMNPTEEELTKALKCPRCSSTDAEKTLIGANFTTFVRGYGWLDKAGVKRDMHIHKLMTDDPYAQYRQSGEVSHIKENLQKKGKVQNNPQYFTSKSNDDT
jgi:hypothetical protein